MLTPRKIDYFELQKMKKFPILRKGTFGGGRIIEQENKRVLPLGKLAARTIGTLNIGASADRSENVGNTGIEQVGQIEEPVGLPRGPEQENRGNMPPVFLCIQILRRSAPSSVIPTKGGARPLSVIPAQAGIQSLLIGSGPRPPPG